MIRAKLLFLSGLCLALVTPAVLAQIPNASLQVDSVHLRRQLETSASLLARSNAVPEFYEGETGDVGPQSVVQYKRHRTFFEASADGQYFFTDNMFLANSGKQSADVLISTVQAALAPTPYEFAGGRLSPRIGYQHQWFNYGLASSDTVKVYDFATATTKSVGLNTFDFSASTVFADAAWRLKNWTFTFGGDYRRLLDTSGGSEFYREYVPRWSLSREFQLNKSLAFSLAYEGDYRMTKTGLPPPTYPAAFNDRTDNSLVFVGSWRLCSHAILQPYYRFQFAHYTRVSCDDYLNSFGLTLYCPLTEQISLRTFVSYDIANTDGLYVQNYQSLNAGGGLNLTVRF